MPPSQPLGKSSREDTADSTVLIFWLFALGHTVLWTLVPTLTQSNVPLDTLEMLYWGHEWEWGYYKHPPLAAWIAESACLLLGRAAWPEYLASQLCVIACFWAVWQLAREILQPWHALCAAMMLEASYYYNYTTPELNNNVVSRTFWALAILFFYRALTRQANCWWLLTGASLALGMLGKYDTAVLIATIVGFLLLHPQARYSWRGAGPYLMFAMGFVLLLPHLHWLVTHNFTTIRYFQNRSASDGVWINHIVNPLKFLVSQLGSTVPLAVVAIPMVAWKLHEPKGGRQFDREFLWSMVLGPVALIVVVSATTGIVLRSMWGTALWSYAGLFLLSLVHLRQDMPALKRTLQLCVAASLMFATALTLHNTVGPLVRDKCSRIQYPGRQLAAEVERRWQRHSSRPLELIGGTWWPAANVAFYAERRASVFADLDPAKSPWASDQELREGGGVILWETDDEEPMLCELRNRFPEATLEPPIQIAWATPAKVPPVSLRMAVIPPRSGEPKASSRLKGAANSKQR